MLVAAAVCPHPPLLLPGLTGAADVATELRSACAAAVLGLLDARPERVVVVGGSATAGTWGAQAGADPSRFRGSGRPPGSPALPLSLAVGRHLLGVAGWRGPVALQAVRSSEGAAQCAALGHRMTGDGERVALLVMGDGSARRGPKAPGYVDERAIAFDGAVRQALATGDAHALAELDAGLAADLLVQGRAAWQVLGGAVRAAGRSPAAELLYADDPFGVLYLVALWTELG